MTRIWLYLLAAGLAIVGCHTAYADSHAVMPQGGVTISPDGQGMVSAEACQAVVTHIPDAGVAYVPGVDATGNPVAPADLPGGDSKIALGAVPIELNLNLRKKFQIPEDARLFNFKAQFGTITVKDNQVYFNGEALGDSEANFLASACRAHGF